MSGPVCTWTKICGWYIIATLQNILRTGENSGSSRNGEWASKIFKEWPGRVRIQRRVSQWNVKTKSCDDRLLIVSNWSMGRDATLYQSCVALEEPYRVLQKYRSSVNQCGQGNGGILFLLLTVPGQWKIFSKTGFIQILLKNLCFYTVRRQRVSNDRPE